MLEEPLVKEARLDVTEESMLGLTQIQSTSRIVKLKHTVDVVGPELNDINAVATLMGQRLTRHTAKIFELWKINSLAKIIYLIK